MSKQTIHYATLIHYFGLLGLLVLWPTILSPSTLFSSYWILFFFLIPLILPMKGLIQGKGYTHAWSTMISLLYFTHAVMEAWTNTDDRWLGLLEVYLSTGLFICSLMFLGKTKAEKQQTANADGQ